MEPTPPRERVVTDAATFTIVPQGAYSLEQSVLFGFGQRHSEQWTGAMRMAFCTDDLAGHAAVVLTQDEHGVHAQASFAPGTEPDVAALQAQVARILSLDHDARPYDAIVAADPVLARLAALRQGMRPPLFHSPYEAAAWGVLSARFRQADVVRARLAREHGHEFELDGVRIAGFPTPNQLLEVTALEGLPPAKLERLHGVARAALAGTFDAQRLRELPGRRALDELQQIPGIGPFYASLVLLRATGLTDVLPLGEPRLRELVGRFWLDGRAPTDDELEAIAEPWQPFRTWASVLVRAAGPALAGDQ